MTSPNAASATPSADQVHRQFKEDYPEIVAADIIAVALREAGMALGDGHTVRYRAERAKELDQIERAFNEAKGQWNVPASHAALSLMRGLLRRATYIDWLAEQRSRPEDGEPGYCPFKGRCEHPDCLIDVEQCGSALMASARSPMPATPGDPVRRPHAGPGQEADRG